MLRSLEENCGLIRLVILPETRSSNYPFFRVFLSFVSRSSDRVTRLFHFTAQVSPAKQLINKDHVDCELRFTLVHPQLSISTVENLKRRSEISIRKKKKRKKKISSRRDVS